jgi:hypothetical protein
MENKASEWARHQLVNSRRPGEDASRVSLRYPASNPGEREPFGLGEGGLDRNQRTRWGGSGHRAPRGWAEIRRLAQ